MSSECGAFQDAITAHAQAYGGLVADRNDRNELWEKFLGLSTSNPTEEQAEALGMWQSPRFGNLKNRHKAEEELLPVLEKCTNATSAGVAAVSRNEDGGKCV
jgi:hypothetical protein